MNFNNAIFEGSYISKDQYPDDFCPEIAFVGRSNVGKSSLINKLLGRKNLARVSATPGKTATANFYRLDEARFVDLPGYGFAKVSKDKRHSWSQLITDYLLSDRDTSLVVLLVDIRHSLMKLDADMIHFLIEEELPFMIAFTKSDKLTETSKKEVLESFSRQIEFFDKIISVAVSSSTGEGISELKELIEESIQ